MKRNCLLIIILFLVVHLAVAQSVSDVIEKVSRDSIIKVVRELSGEDSVNVNASKVIIKHRVSNSGNNLAAQYIFEKLKSFGLDVESIDYSSKGRNIVATKLGSVYPNRVYMLCAHYDAVADYCADDNASGTSAVIEAARILSKIELNSTVIFALWDEEELGLYGAHNYANSAAANNKRIDAVLNVDMIGCDGDGDKLFNLDIRNVKNSYQIKTDLFNLVSQQNIDLVGKVVDPGTGASDHAAFWSSGYSAAFLGEAWSENDQCPAYHSANDRITLFNLDYFYNMVKLSVAYISSKALKDFSTDVDVARKSYRIYPNPAYSNLVVEFGDGFEGEIDLFNSNGQLLKSSYVYGESNIIDVQGLESSLYILKVKNESGTQKSFRFIKK